MRYLLGVSQERFPPESLLELAAAAERAGYDGISTGWRWSETLGDA